MFHVALGRWDEAEELGGFGGPAGVEMRRRLAWCCAQVWRSETTAVPRLALLNNSDIGRAVEVGSKRPAGGGHLDQKPVDAERGPAEKGQHPNAAASTQNHASTNAHRTACSTKHVPRGNRPLADDGKSEEALNHLERTMESMDDDIWVQGSLVAALNHDEVATTAINAVNQLAKDNLDTRTFEQHQPLEGKQNDYLRAVQTSLVGGKRNRLATGFSTTSPYHRRCTRAPSKTTPSRQTLGCCSRPKRVANHASKKPQPPCQRRSPGHVHAPVGPHHHHRRDARRFGVARPQPCRF